jgi:hypothetical protein
MREVNSIQVEWLLELAPHFYVDRRKQMIEEQHRKEALRNIEHDLPKKRSVNNDSQSIMG